MATILMMPAKMGTLGLLNQIIELEPKPPFKICVFF